MGNNFKNIQTTWSELDTEYFSSPLMKAAVEDIQYLIRELMLNQRENEQLKELNSIQNNLLNSIYLEKELYVQKIAKIETAIPIGNESKDRSDIFGKTMHQKIEIRRDKK